MRLHQINLPLAAFLFACGTYGQIDESRTGGQVTDALNSILPAKARPNKRLANWKKALEFHFEQPQASRPPKVRTIEVEVGATQAPVVSRDYVAATRPDANLGVARRVTR